MNEVKLPSRDSATGRGIATALQAVVGFVVGLVLTVWAVPGVPEAVAAYFLNGLDKLLPAAALFGGATGVVSFLVNVRRPEVKNY